MRETIIRILSTIAFLPVLYFTVANQTLDSLFFGTLIAIIGILALIELYQMFQKKGYDLNLYLLIPLVLGIYACYYFRLEMGYIAGILLLTLIIGISLELLNNDFEKVVLNTSLMLFSMIYIGIMWGVMISLKQNNINHLIVLILTTWFCDIGAYFVGKFFGKRKLNLQASPNKTLEGFIGGIVTSALVGFLTCWIIGISFYWWIVLIPFATIIGDLLESILKRFTGVKDSGKMVPGHGGILDVFDALIFTAPIYYFCLKLSGAL